MTGPIGVFDSGYGGLTVLRELIDHLPEYSYLYLGDNAREPYGPRSQEEIFKFTLQCVEFLFEQGCPLVVLACNTSSANALRRIQQEVLQEKYPDRRVLGVLAPAVEEITGCDWNGEGQAVGSAPQAVTTVGIIGTPATIASGAYTREIKKRNDKIQVFEQACPNLANLIVNKAPEDEIKADIRSCLDNMHDQMRTKGSELPPDAVLIGCTHYALVKDILTGELSDQTRLIDQGPVTANRLQSYLEQHPEIESLLSKEQTHKFLTTDDPEKVSKLASVFFRNEIKFEQIKLA
jgi:glutamate racemase